MQSALTTSGGPLYVAFTDYQSAPGEKPPSAKNTLFISTLNQPTIEEIDADTIIGEINIENLPAEVKTGQIDPLRIPYAEKKENRVNVINANSTDMQYPSASAVYSLVASISGGQPEGVELLSNRVTEVTPLSTDEKYPSAKAVNTAIFNAIQEVTSTIPQGVELLSNKVTAIAPGLTDDQYMSARLVQGILTQMENSIPIEAELKQNKVTAITVDDTDDDYPSAKAVYTALSQRDDEIANKAYQEDVLMNDGDTMTGILKLQAISDDAGTNLLQTTKLDGMTVLGGLQVRGSGRMALVDDIGKSILLGPASANSEYKEYKLPGMTTASSATLLTDKTPSNVAICLTYDRSGLASPITVPVSWDTNMGYKKLINVGPIQLDKIAETGFVYLSSPIPLSSDDTVVISPATYTGIISDGYIKISWENQIIGTELIDFYIIINERESQTNKIKLLDQNSTDAQYPSAKCVYDQVNGRENVTNKVTSMSSASTDVQYPSAKCVYDQVVVKESTINKVTSLSNTVTDTQYPSAKSVYTSMLNLAAFGVLDGNWKGPSSITGYWNGIAVSSNGKIQYAASYGSKVYKSVDYGMSWQIALNVDGSWAKICCSKSGQYIYLVATSNSSCLYQSSDYGVTWTKKISGVVFNSCCCNGLGNVAYAVVSYGVIRKTIDYGDTWTTATTATNVTYQSLCCSEDGGKVALSGYDGKIYISADFAASWSEKGSTRKWASCVCSGDFNKIYIPVDNSYIYYSSDQGQTWTTRSNQAMWSNISCSGDGSVVAVGITDSYFYISTDSGLSWNSQYTLPLAKWRTAAVSYDGNLIVASITNNGAIYQKQNNLLVSQGGEVTSNKVTTLSDLSTNTQYPGAKCTYDAIKEVDSAIPTRTEYSFTCVAGVLGFSNFEATMHEDMKFHVPQITIPANEHPSGTTATWSVPFSSGEVISADFPTIPSGTVEVYYSVIKITISGSHAEIIVPAFDIQLQNLERFTFGRVPESQVNKTDDFDTWTKSYLTYPSTLGVYNYVEETLKDSIIYDTSESTPLTLSLNEGMDVPPGSINCHILTTDLRLSRKKVELFLQDATLSNSSEALASVTYQLPSMGGVVWESHRSKIYIPGVDAEHYMIAEFTGTNPYYVKFSVSKTTSMSVKGVDFNFLVRII